MGRRALYATVQNTSVLPSQNRVPEESSRSSSYSSDYDKPWKSIDDAPDYMRERLEQIMKAPMGRLIFIERTDSAIVVIEGSETVPEFYSTQAIQFAKKLCKKRKARVGRALSLTWSEAVESARKSLAQTRAGGSGTLRQLSENAMPPNSTSPAPMMPESNYGERSSEEYD